MPKPVQAFLQSVTEAFDLRGPVYEFGYYPVEASTDGRKADGACEHGSIGSESADGAETERLPDLQPLPFADGSAGTVVCINALQHVGQPARVVEEMVRILAPGGLLLICSSSVETGSPHGRRPLTVQTLQPMLASLEATLLGWQGPSDGPHTLLAIGCKPPLPDTLLASINRFVERLQARLSQRPAPIGWRARVRQILTACLLGSNRQPASRNQPEPHFLIHLPLRRPINDLLLSVGLPDQKTGGRLDCSG